MTVKGILEDVLDVVKEHKDDPPVKDAIDWVEQKIREVNADAADEFREIFGDDQKGEDDD
jgi:hypothetical protein